MKRTGRMMIAFCCLTAFFASGSRAYAAGAPAVRNAYTADDSVVLYVNRQDADIETVYLGNDAVSEFSVEDMGAVRTIVIVDNSLSIQESYRDAIRDFLGELVAARSDGDTFVIATFAQDVTYLVEESNNYLDIKAKIDALQFENQDSYFNHSLYEVIDAAGDCEEIRYTRVIVIADGMDDDAYGYTDDELNRKIQEAKLPVYVIGCTSGGNAENLKKMFSLARMSNAKSYLLDDMTGAEILRDISDDTDVVKVTVVPQDGLCDGTAKTVRISYGEEYCTTEVTMPFKAAEEKAPEAESATESVESETTESEPTFVPETAEPDGTTAEADSGRKLSYIVLIGISAAAAAAILAVVAVICTKKKKTPEKSESVDLDGIGKYHGTDTETGTDTDRETEETETDLFSGSGREQKKEATDLTDLMAKKTVMLCLRDLNAPSRTFEYPVRDKLLIGRSKKKCQIVIDYDTMVSAVHCEITAKKDGLYVRDGGGDVSASKNGTFVNEKRVERETPLPNGAELRLGKVRFQVAYHDGIRRM